MMDHFLQRITERTFETGLVNSLAVEDGYIHSKKISIPSLIRAMAT
jgi:hypothetical protein